MSNTYFKIEKEVSHNPVQFGDKTIEGYTNNYSLSLTAFVGTEHTGTVQLTVHTSSTIHGQSGTAYITLNDSEIDKLIFGLLERKLKLVSATSEEQSIICPNND